MTNRENSRDRLLGPDRQRGGQPLRRRRLGGARRRQQPAGRVLRPAGRHPLEPEAARRHAWRTSTTTSSTSATGRRSSTLVAEIKPDRDRPHRRPALPRPGRGDPVRRLRHQRRRHAQPAGGRPPGLPGEPVRPHVAPTRSTATPPTRSPLRGTRHPLGLRRPDTTPTASRRSFRIDQCKHSLFGASKVAADVMVQEYGRYFGMPTCCLRGGCLTGPDPLRASSCTASSATS